MSPLPRAASSGGRQQSPSWPTVRPAGDLRLPAGLWQRQGLGRAEPCTQARLGPVTVGPPSGGRPAVLGEVSFQ